MALGATIHTFAVQLADVDRGVYEELALRVARHPSETESYMMTRVLAYCLEYEEGIEMTTGLSSGDEPALVVRDLTGRITKWIEVGLPDAERLHRGSKVAASAAVYTHRDVRRLLEQLNGEKIHRAEALTIRAFDRFVIEEIANLLDRRVSFSLIVSDGELTLSLGDHTFAIPMTEHRLT